jgi:hypothetical protein
VRIRHTFSADKKLVQAHKVLGLSNAVYDLVEAAFKRMALTPITGAQLVGYVQSLIPDNPKAASNTRTQNIRAEILNIHESPSASTSMVRGTAFGAYNAVTEYTDHMVAVDNSNKRLASVWFGGGEKLKLKAFQLADKMFLN